MNDLASSQISILSFLTGVKLNESVLGKRKEPEKVVDAIEEDIVQKVVVEETKKEAVRLRDLGEDPEDNIGSLRTRFNPNTDAKRRKVEQAPQDQGKKVEIYDSSDSEMDDHQKP